tara:strand:- start:1911 stop:2297 length:387 start_codon:yes stop_codon:yes gene_type:complete
MKRDMDLIRSLLLFLEERDDLSLIQASDILIGDASQPQVQYHLNLMFQAGLIDGEPVRSTSSDRLIYVVPFALTWTGHEFLESVRDPEIWRQAKSGASKAGTAGIEFIWGLAKAALTRAIADQTGVAL